MRLLLVIPFLLGATAVVGQQLSQYTQYVFNQFSVNPAVAGSKQCLDVRLGYRQQWVGLEGAPVTGWASVHGALRGKKRKGYQTNVHGIGGFVEADNAGNWGYTRFLLAYAYNMQLSRDMHMSMGLFGGVQQMKLNVGDIVLSDFNDPVLGSASSVMVAPEITPGIWLYNKSTFGGVAVHQVLANRIPDIGTDSKLARQFMLSGGHRFRVARKTSLTPSALLKFAAGVPMALDLNAMLEYNRVIGFGAGYRSGDALTLMMRVGFLQYFQLGYSYDITTSRLRNGSSNTHEIILAITPCGKDDPGKRMINCPAFD